MFQPSSVKFRGSNRAEAIVSLMPTRAARATMANIVINVATHAALNTIEIPVEYEQDPDECENRIRQQVCETAIELVNAVAYACAKRAVLITISGMPVPAALPQTPKDGRVIESNVRVHVRNLVAAVTALGQAGIGYATENEQRLLRAVAPVKEVGEQANSQGFGDLVWHTDNPQFRFCWVPEPHSRGAIINQWQNFVAVRPQHPPMEVLAVKDLVDGVTRRHGVGVIDALQRLQFGVQEPPSHGRGAWTLEVPLLVPNEVGNLCCRFNAAAVVGMTPDAQSALEKFRAEAGATDAVNIIRSLPGSLVMYSNYECMHRRSKYIPALDGTDRYYIRLYSLPREALADAKDTLNGRIFK